MSKFKVGDKVMFIINDMNVKRAEEIGLDPHQPQEVRDLPDESCVFLVGAGLFSPVANERLELASEWAQHQVAAEDQRRLDHYIQPLARVNDPATSHKAAATVSKKAGKIADVILVALRCTPQTGKELAHETGIALNSITPRFAQLARKGLIHAITKRDGQHVWALGNGVA